MNKVGIIGAGQLGQMLGFAGIQLGLQCTFLDPADAPPAASAGLVIADQFNGARGLQELARHSDVISYEFENVPVESIETLAPGTVVYPPVAALRHAQDRMKEKRLFAGLDIPVAGYRAVDTPAELEAALDELGLPLVVKTRRMGYDGKGQIVVRHRSDAAAVFATLGEADLIAEQWVEFEREISAIGVRSVSGELAFYPLTENRHADGILRESRAPLEDHNLTTLATDYVQRMLTHLDYVGVLVLELFVCGEKLLANEFAPRVHNSGHWTIEGAVTSQFENHLRAILDKPLGATHCIAHAGMINLIGHMPATAEIKALENTFVHDYGKAPRPGRKLGHITVLGETPATRDQRLRQLMALLSH